MYVTHHVLDSLHPTKPEAVRVLIVAQVMESKSVLKVGPGAVAVIQLVRDALEQVRIYRRGFVPVTSVLFRLLDHPCVVVFIVANLNVGDGYNFAVSEETSRLLDLRALAIDELDHDVGTGRTRLEDPGPKSLAPVGGLDGDFGVFFKVARLGNPALPVEVLCNGDEDGHLLRYPMGTK